MHFKTVISIECINIKKSMIITKKKTNHILASNNTQEFDKQLNQNPTGVETRLTDSTDHTFNLQTSSPPTLRLYFHNVLPGVGAQNEDAIVLDFL